MSIERFVPGDTPLTRTAPSCSASQQDTLAGRYPRWVGYVAMVGFTIAFAGWLNETWFFLWESPIWLNRYTEYAIILGFGVWRIASEKNAYTRKRLMILVSVVTVLWWLIPWLWPFYEHYVGYLWARPVFPSLHTPGTMTFILVLGLVFLFGRRIICGFGCPCVGIRETVGFPFRHKTIRGDWANRLRHIKWLFFIWYMGVLVVTQFPPTGWTTSFVGFFGLLVALTYFGSFYIIPFTGNRFYCRSLCPFGATFGVLNHAGFYDIRMDTDRCIGPGFVWTPATCWVKAISKYCLKLKRPGKMNFSRFLRYNNRPQDALIAVNLPAARPVLYKIESQNGWPSLSRAT